MSGRRGAAADILVLGSLVGVRPNHQGWLRVRCPFCPMEYGKADRGTSLAVRPGTGAYVCFRCHARGRVDPAMLTAHDVAGGSTPPVEEAPYLGPPEGYVPLWDRAGMTSVFLEGAREFLTGRGIGAGLWERAGIGACVSGYYSGRVVVPVRRPGGEWAGWVGRLWASGSHAAGNYAYPRGMKRGERLYNGEVLDHVSDIPVVVVEGVLDAIYCGLDSSVAVLGSPSNSHYDLLRRSRRPVCVVLDGDAWRAGWALAYKLQLDGVRAGSVRLGPRVDPDEVPAATLAAAAAGSIGRFDSVVV